MEYCGAHSKGMVAAAITAEVSLLVLVLTVLGMLVKVVKLLQGKRTKVDEKEEHIYDEVQLGPRLDKPSQKKMPLQLVDDNYDGPYLEPKTLPKGGMPQATMEDVDGYLDPKGVVG